MFDGLKQYTEKIQDYIFYVHHCDDRSLPRPKDLKSFDIPPSDSQEF